MQKIVVHRRGGYDRLVLERHEAPRCGPGEVHVEVAAIGVNYADCIVRMGLYASARKYVGWPITPGFEVAGVVRRVGAGVVDLAVGTRVLAVTRFGGYATEVVVPRRQVIEVPGGMDLVQAAGFPAAHLTAWYALGELARPHAGAQVLVHSAAGGVGLALVRIARILGCEVVGVVGSAAKVEVARAAGCRAVIDKSSDPLWSKARDLAPAGYDVVLDANGVETLRESYRHVAPTGKLVIYGFATMLPRGGRPIRWTTLAWQWLRTPRFDPLRLTYDNKSVMGFNLSLLFDRHRLLARALEVIAGWADEGRLPPPPCTTYPLARAADAHRDLESGRTVGKLVLVPEAAR
jgi:NADPH:quinone reductase-like Zn-dependent oxidoreductase